MYLSNLNMNNIEFRKILQTIWCKIKDLTHIHNNLEGLQGGQEGQYYHLTEEQYNRFCENQLLIDMDFIPTEISASILERYNNYVIPAKSKVYPYFVKSGLSKLTANIAEFY